MGIVVGNSNKLHKGGKEIQLNAFKLGPMT